MVKRTRGRSLGPREWDMPSIQKLRIKFMSDIFLKIYRFIFACRISFYKLSGWTMKIDFDFHLPDEKQNRHAVFFSLFCFFMRKNSGERKRKKNGDFCIIRFNATAVLSLSFLFFQSSEERMKGMILIEQAPSKIKLKDRNGIGRAVCICLFICLLFPLRIEIEMQLDPEF